MPYRCTAGGGWLLGSSILAAAAAKSKRLRYRAAGQHRFLRFSLFERSAISRSADYFRRRVAVSNIYRLAGPLERSRCSEHRRSIRFAKANRHQERRRWRKRLLPLPIITDSTFLESERLRSNKSNLIRARLKFSRLPNLQIAMLGLHSILYDKPSFAFNYGSNNVGIM